MGKELIISTIIIIVIVALNIVTQNYTKASVKHMDEELNYLKQSMIQEEKENVDRQIETIMKEWKERKNRLEYFIEHDELEKVETELSGLAANILIGEYKQGIPEIDKSIFILNHIKEKFTLKIQNIF